MSFGLDFNAVYDINNKKSYSSTNIHAGYEKKKRKIGLSYDVESNTLNAEYAYKRFKLNYSSADGVVNLGYDGIASIGYNKKDGAFQYDYEGKGIVETIEKPLAAASIALGVCYLLEKDKIDSSIKHYKEKWRKEVKEEIQRFEQSLSGRLNADISFKIESSLLEYP